MANHPCFFRFSPLQCPTNFTVSTLISLHMWETICDARAWKKVARRNFCSNWQEHPVLGFGPEHPPPPLKFRQTLGLWVLTTTERCSWRLKYVETNRCIPRGRDTTLNFHGHRLAFRHCLHGTFFFLRPQTKLRKGNVFTPVCDSVHGGGWRCTPHGYTSPRADTHPHQTATLVLKKTAC